MVGYQHGPLFPFFCGLDVVWSNLVSFQICHAHLIVALGCWGSAVFWPPIDHRQCQLSIGAEWGWSLVLMPKCVGWSGIIGSYHSLVGGAVRIWWFWWNRLVQRILWRLYLVRGLICNIEPCSRGVVPHCYCQSGLMAFSSRCLLHRSGVIFNVGGLCCTWVCALPPVGASYGEGYRAEKWNGGSCSDIFSSQWSTSIMVKGLPAPYVESWVAMGICT